MRFLGIDYGSHRIGLALSDHAAMFSYPHLVLENKGIARAVELVAKICREEEVGLIVVGESLDYKGKENKVMVEIRQFAKLLEEKTGIPLELENETLTSAEAERLQGKNSMHDAAAAAIILRSYLERSRRRSDG
ncbi:MAG: Holliday junction resolvase RuvX [Candidatus Vogelbacteria bacterium CG10_big_fil_rev_8_21_14_0_10_51_16]|uniref:Putative pre-16S rRNA nuclease n=1 Tax=Candidatus Vogelbacteria bacterium CG10_big_fil_rev_8_21_14_0_10_51_16 TaxID=1975045 RepID=A0A2H0RHA6_9BACT|nr:MAG: Holliday junction resolvase RuvX [Candidatus Vogelbacteria bacterium CG10_big_fil_rev_8_21_14_0_10_51_16]